MRRMLMRPSSSGAKTKFGNLRGNRNEATGNPTGERPACIPEARRALDAMRAQDLVRYVPVARAPADMAGRANGQLSVLSRPTARHSNSGRENRATIVERSA